MSDFEMLLSKYVDLPGKGVAHISVFQISKTKRYERFINFPMVGSVRSRVRYLAYGQENPVFDRKANFQRGIHQKVENVS